jgi:hypothetical protein
MKKSQKRNFISMKFTFWAMKMARRQAMIRIKTIFTLVMTASLAISAAFG